MLLVESIKRILYILWNSAINRKILALAIIIFSAHIIYSAKINYGDTLEKYAEKGKKLFNGGAGTLVKVLQSYTTPKEFYKRVKRRERRSDNTQTSRFTILLRLLLLCSGKKWVQTATF